MMMLDFLQMRVLWLVGAWLACCFGFMTFVAPLAAKYVQVNPGMGLIAVTFYFAWVIKQTVKRNPSPFEA